MSNERKSSSSVFRYARILSRPSTSSSAQAALEQQARPRTESNSGATTSNGMSSDPSVIYEEGHEKVTADESAAGAQAHSLHFEAEGPLNALALHGDRTRAAIAGREVLKILKLAGEGIHEEANLRDTNQVNLNHASNDVKWGIGVTSDMVAIATTNGSIVTWDPEHDTGRRATRVINGHQRAANRLSFNPGNGSWLLSASQDGSMKLWDLRDRDHGTRFILKGKAEAVRDVQFNASNALELAAVFENGTLQKWDLRQPSMYERKLNAHQGLALAVDWHADGRHVVTGGRDKVIKIWDIGSENQRKPVTFLHTLAPVSRVAWRPGDVRTTYEIASCSFSMENVVRLWNLRRPYLASRVFETHEAVATGIVWRNEDTLLSCSKDRRLCQHAVSAGSAPVDYLSHYSFSWNANDDIAVTLGSRRSDKYRLEQINQALQQQLKVQQDVSTAERRQKLVRTPSTIRFDPKQQPYEPVQSFAVIEPEDDRVELFRYLAMNYDLSSTNPVASCAHNAHVAQRAQQAQIEKSWKLIRLALTQAERRTRHSQAQAKKHSGNSSQLHKEHVVHKHLERLRHPTESGVSTARANSPSNSFIMPKYQDSQAVPASPLSHAISTLPGRPPTAMSLSRSGSTPEPQSNQPENGSRPLPVEQAISSTPGVGSPAESISPRMTTQSFDSSASEANAWGETTVRYRNAGHFGSFGSSTTDSVHSDTQETPPPGKTTSTGQSVEMSDATLQPAAEAVSAIPELLQEPADDRPYALRQLAVRLLDYYRELGNVQMCSTLCLILQDKIDVDETMADEWHYCYLELLQRQKLFVQAAKLIKATHSTTIRAFAEGDTSIYLSCARCHKQVPLVRDSASGGGTNSTSGVTQEAGLAWTCPRCSNTTLCLVCHLMIRGHASWCHSCGHAMHLTCKLAWREADTGVTGACVAPNCHCQCSP